MDSQTIEIPMDIREESRWIANSNPSKIIEAKRHKMNFSELVRFILAEWLRGRGWMGRREP